MTQPSSGVHYSAPSGETVLVKWLSLSNGAALNALIVFNIDQGFGAPIEVIRRSLSGIGDVQIPLWWVLQPGDSITWSVTAGTVTFGFFGAELEGVAD